MKSCLIISGGKFSSIDKKDFPDFDYVIACDKGLEYANRLKINVNLAIGDFDSFFGELSDTVETVRLPCEKDDTDTMYAVREAMKRGFSKIIIICALGKRFDHTIGNLQAAVFAVKNGVSVEILSKKERLHFFSNGKISLKKRDGFSLSVFSLSDKCTGVYERGTKYTLENAVLENSVPIGVCNEWASEVAEIGLKEGIMLVVESKKR